MQLFIFQSVVIIFIRRLVMVTEPCNDTSHARVMNLFYSMYSE
jgi:hypothetical protein